jgi:hypothetical protein
LFFCTGDPATREVGGQNGASTYERWEKETMQLKACLRISRSVSLVLRLRIGNRKANIEFDASGVQPSIPASSTGCGSATAAAATF